MRPPPGYLSVPAAWFFKAERRSELFAVSAQAHDRLLLVKNTAGRGCGGWLAGGLVSELLSAPASSAKDSMALTVSAERWDLPASWMCVWPPGFKAEVGSI